MNVGIIRHPVVRVSMSIRHGVRLLVMAGLLSVLTGCAGMVVSAMEGLTDSLSAAILNQDDPKTVEDGAPSYLLLIDGLIEGQPDNERLLVTGARLYSAYASVFVKDEDRGRRLSGKAHDYGRRALCSRSQGICQRIGQPYDEFVVALEQLDKSDVPALYTFAATWAGWVQANRNDWNAVADLAKVEACMRRVVELDEAYERGGAHLYLGILSTLVPPALGGKPEQGRDHFERALALSRGRDLMVKVQYAERYARLVFNRELHDRLLQEVVQADASEPGLTLLNTLAKEQAQQLLASADSYF